MLPARCCAVRPGCWSRWRPSPRWAGRAGLAIASTYVTAIGVYCLLNFLRCRETHCAVTGPGFLLTAALGFAAALLPGPALSWYRTGIEAVVYLAILAVGYGLEQAVAARTGRRVLR